MIAKVPLNASSRVPALRGPDKISNAIQTQNRAVCSFGCTFQSALREGHGDGLIILVAT